MTCRIACVIVLLGIHAVAADAQEPAIVGSWRGTSTCADKVHFPGCNDEQVIYDVAAKPGTRDTVTVRADKIVNGVREFMGEFDCHRATDGSWVADYQNPRVRIQIVLRVTGSHITGTLNDLPTGYRVRDITLDRAS